MREVLAELRKALAEDRACVWCSLIETRGSTPQKAGAAMLVFPDGSQCGTLGGGCVEAEVKQRALRVLSAGDKAAADVLTFHLDDNYGWDDGLICGGRMSILADPLAAYFVRGSFATSSAGREHIDGYYRILQELVEKGSGCTEAVVMNEHGELPVGSRFLFDHNGELLAQLSEHPPSEQLIAALKPVQGRPKPYTVHGTAYLPIWPRITILIVGGGHVGLAVAKLAAEVDFDVWILDDREMFVSKQRFPMAERHFVGDIGQTLGQLTRSEINASTFCLIVTRGHNHDEEALYYLAESKAGYVGMIGSKRKIKLIFDDLIARGISKEALDRVHAPLGFDIGSQTVPEIAVSIVAELIACRNLGHTIAEARLKVHP